MPRPMLPVLALHPKEGDVSIEIFKHEWSFLIDHLELVYRLQYFKSRQLAKDAMAGEGVRVAISLDAASAAVVKLSGLLERGGAVIFCGPMASSTHPDFFEKCFSKFGLPWKQHSLLKANFFSHTPATKLGLPAVSFRSQAVLLSGVAADHVVFSPWKQSEADDPGSAAEPDVAAVAFGAVDGGWVGYVGDVHADEACTSIVLAMLLWTETFRLPGCLSDPPA